MKKILIITVAFMSLLSQAQTINKKRIQSVRNSVARIIVNNSSSGTGFFVSPTGLMITNNHVIQPALIRDPKTNGIIGVRKIELEFNDGEKLEMGIVSSFLKESYISGIVGDFVLLAPNEATDRVFEYLLLGNWSDVEDGEYVYTAGFPFGIKQQVVTSGLFSTKFVDTVVVTDKGQKTKHIKNAAWLDMTLNAGNSGGPVIVMKKNQKKDRVIGIASFVINPYAKDAVVLSQLFGEATKKMGPNIMNADKAVSILFKSVAQNSLGISGAVSLDYIYSRLRQQNLIQQQKTFEGKL